MQKRSKRFISRRPQPVPSFKLQEKSPPVTLLVCKITLHFQVHTATCIYRKFHTGIISFAPKFASQLIASENCSSLNYEILSCNFRFLFKTESVKSYRSYYHLIANSGN